MKVKILDSNLIRRYGGTNIEMNECVAFKLQQQGKVKIIEPLAERELDSTGTVLIFSSEPKEKIDSSKRVPAPDEPIFPQITV